MTHYLVSTDTKIQELGSKFGLNRLLKHKNLEHFHCVQSLLNNSFIHYVMSYFI